ncbi:MAG: DUF3847 domain-containing protein [Lachnospiraceae bacterium]|nr:DUF3847 domain-containing protein [Lachnospiraceae bacterium]
MSTARRTLDERLAEKQRLLEAEREKLKAYEAQMRALTAKKRDEDRRARTHRLIQIGAAVESVLHQPITEDMIPLLLDFLERQERNGRYFSRAIGVTDTGNADAGEEQGGAAEDGEPERKDDRGL